MGINLPIVELVFMGHVDVAHMSLQVVDFIIMAVKSSCELVNACIGCSELLSADGSTMLHGGCEAVGNSAGNVTKLVLSEADEGFGRSGGERGVRPFPSGLIGEYME